MISILSVARFSSNNKKPVRNGFQTQFGNVDIGMP